MITGADWLKRMKGVERSIEARSQRMVESKKSPAMKFADLRRRVGAVFGPETMSCVVNHPSFGITIEPEELEKFLAKKHPDFPKVDEGDAIENFIASKYGRDIADWVVENI
jgi:hypothetical protein